MRNRAWTGAVCALGLLVGAALAAGEELRLILPSAPTDPVIAEGFGGDDLERLGRRGAGDLPSVLGLFVDGDDEVPPMLGAHRLDAGQLIFVPRFPFQPGQRYRVEFVVGDHRTTETFVIERAEMVPTTRVTGIDPALAEVPENLLRFYIYFSAPMRGEGVYRHVRLIDERGERIAQAIVETEPALWDREQRRLTLISHPGRIKRGLEMRERQGSTLSAGARFRLQVDAEMLDAAGVPMVESFSREFSVTAADRRSPAVANWIVQAPAAAGDRLTIDFDEPLDRALLRRLIAVETTGGKPVPGRGEPGPEGRSWRFHPQVPWADGTYSVLVHPSLEDLAGNRLDRLFDVAGEGAAEAERSEPIRLPFALER